MDLIHSNFTLFSCDKAHAMGSINKSENQSCFGLLPSCPFCWCPLCHDLLSMGQAKGRLTLGAKFETL